MSIWIVLILCFIPFLFFTKFTKKFRDKYPDTFGYIFTLTGTFIGVFVGLYITSIQANNDRKGLTVKVLEAGKKEMQWLIERANRLVKASDTLNYRELEQLKELESPSFFTETMRTELMAEMLDPYTIEEFNRIKEKMFFDIELTIHETAREQKKDFKNDLEDYRQHLLVTISVIDEEIERLKGKVNVKTYEEKASKRLDSFINSN